jgi:hypothetical protein
MAVMSPDDRQRALVAVVLLVITLLISAQYPPLSRWRRQLMIGSIVLFLAAVVAAVVEIMLWLTKGVL